MEFVRSMIYTMCFITYWLIEFALESKPMHSFQCKVQKFSYMLLDPISYSFVPVLSLLMNLLWLAYRIYEFSILSLDGHGILS